MVHRFLATCSFVCCTLVIASFAFFAVDQVSGASSHQVAQIAGSATPANGHVHHGAFRRFVDGAARDLTYPVHSLAQSSSQWANQILLVVLGLAIYGVGLGYLGRYSSGLP
jgi:hypothetical protein